MKAIKTTTIAPASWIYDDQQSPYTRVLGTASGLEGAATGFRMAAMSLHDPEILAATLSGAGDLVQQLAAVLVAQASRMEDCPRCSHATQPLEANPTPPDRNGTGAAGQAD